MLDKWQNISACADLEGRAVEKERVSLHGGPPSAEPVQVVRLGPLTPPVLSIVTPLTVRAWAEALSSHLDQAFVEYLVDGICWGFHSGYGGGNRHRKQQPAHSQPAPE